MQAWLDALHAAHTRVALLYWHAPHTPPTHPLRATVASLARCNPGLLRVCCVDVHTHAKNQTLGFNGRVLKHPDSHRPGARARPVLAVGHPFPAVSVHDVPALHPTRLHAGPDVVNALVNHLRALLPSLVEDARGVEALPQLLPVPRNPAVQRLTEGPGQLKRMMQAAAAEGVALVVLWLHDDESPETRAAQDVVHALVRKGVAVAEGDVRRPANRLVASKLGAAAYPAVQVFYNMTLQGTCTGGTLAVKLQQTLGKFSSGCREVGRRTEGGERARLTHRQTAARSLGFRVALVR